MSEVCEHGVTAGPGALCAECRVTLERTIASDLTAADLIQRALETVERATPGPWRLTDNRQGAEAGSAANGVLAEVYGDTSDAIENDAAAIALLGTIGPHLLAVAAAALSPKPIEGSGWTECRMCGATPDLCPSGPLVPPEHTCPRPALLAALRAHFGEES